MKPRKKIVPLPQRSRAELEEELHRLRSQLDDRQGQLEKRSLLQAQREVEASRERYVELYEFAPVGYLTLDPQGIIRTLNLTATVLLGRARDQLVGHPFLTLVTRADRRRFLAHLRRLRCGQPHSTIDLELPRPGAPPVAVQVVSVAPLGEGARGMDYRTALVDLSDRKRAEARTAALGKLGLALSAATEPGAAAQAVVDAVQEYCGWDACFLAMHEPYTDSFVDLVQLERLEGQLGVMPASAHSRPLPALLRQVMQEGPQLVLRRGAAEKAPAGEPSGHALRESLSLMFNPMRLAHKSVGVLSVQSYRRNAYTSQDLAALQGIADHAAVALARLAAEDSLLRVNELLEARVAERTHQLQEYHDRLEELVKWRTAELQTANERLRDQIAIREAAERSLLRTAEELKRSNTDLEQFAYVASHDLQEPLRAVGGYVRLLEHRFPATLDDKARQYIAGAVEGANRMEQLIMDLLTFSRLSTEAREPARANLNVPLNSALQNLQFRIKAARATVIADPLPVVAVDESQVVQLFQNLIANALKFSGERPPEIHIGARPEDGKWVVWVRDNGIGMEPQYFERVFQVFQRLHTRKQYPGTGIGLAICKRIVERHGGKIWIESKPKEGSTFYFSLPADSSSLETTS
jgi:PAS domain S-box-containing protein